MVRHCLTSLAMFLSLSEKFFGRPGLTLGDLIDTGHINLAALGLHCHKECSVALINIRVSSVKSVAHGLFVVKLSSLKIVCLQFVERPCLQKEKNLSVKSSSPQMFERVLRFGH